MLLLCTEDIFKSEYRIFTAGKTYRAVCGPYVETLTEEEENAFQTLSNNNPFIKEMMNWKIIRSINDLNESWILEIIEDCDCFSIFPFKNKNFVQISTF